MSSPRDDPFAVIEQAASRQAAEEQAAKALASGSREADPRPRCQKRVLRDFGPAPDARTQLGHRHRRHRRPLPRVSPTVRDRSEPGRTGRRARSRSHALCPGSSRATGEPRQRPLERRL